MLEAGVNIKTQFMHHLRGLNSFNREEAHEQRQLSNQRHLNSLTWFGLGNRLPTLLSSDVFAK